MQDIEKQIRTAVLEERERCALIAEGFVKNRDWVPGSLYEKIRKEVAHAIRLGVKNHESK